MALTTAVGLAGVAVWPSWAVAATAAAAVFGAAAMGFRVRVRDQAPPPGSASKIPPRRHRPDRHLHCAALFAELALFAFTVAFALDAFLTQRTYLTLRAGHVAVTAQPNNCPVKKASLYGGSRINRCTLTFVYAGRYFHVTQPQFEAQVLLVDPKSPSINMTAANYGNAGNEVVGDVVVSGICTAAAIGVASFHLQHMRRRRQERDLWRRMHTPD